MVTQKGILTFVISLLFVSYGLAQELRLGVEYDKELLPKFKTGLQLQVRNNFNSPGFFDRGLAQADLKYNLLNNIAFGVTLRYTGVFEEEDEENEEEKGFGYGDRFRGTVDFTAKTNWINKEVRLSNRFRYQFSQRETKNKTFFRNKVKCDYKMTKNVSSYIAVEPFYSIEDKAFDTYRLHLGSEFDLVYNEIEVYIIIEVVPPDGEAVQLSQFIGLSYKL